MHSKKLAAALAVAAFMGLAGTAAQAQSFVVEIAPPAPVYEAVPAPRSGYVWANGHYEWRGGEYRWVPGHWIAERPGYEFREHRWVQRGNGQWYMVGGNWERRGPYGDRDRDGVANRYDSDRDGDGIPNRYDNRGRGNRMGPYGDLDRDGIANREDRDIDGDGIRNRRDAYPYDRRRS